MSGVAFDATDEIEGAAAVGDPPPKKEWRLRVALAGTGGDAAGVAGVMDTVAAASGITAIMRHKRRNGERNEQLDLEKKRGSEGKSSGGACAAE